MTANAMAEHREQCIAAGMDDYIAKPVRIESLAAALEYWGARAGAPHAATSRSVAEASADASAHTEIPGRPVANQESGLTDEILRLFLEDSPTQINAIREALSVDDAEAVRHAAHSLKGSAGYVGASRLASICAGIERLAREQDLGEARAQFK